ncbi:TetR/AcrR family transcriptional regulator [Sphingobium chungbukense]|uniref:TetR/AcrR family transcriptional regulator n=1 Tax=Sphingobium chungbukense TaxID=56193 RepID=UPI0009FF81D4|nr:TetR/AcrR family transcriptional regulator [Sphingobium chungbukense]
MPLRPCQQREDRNVPALRRPPLTQNSLTETHRPKRKPAQARSVDTRKRIIEGAIRVLADQGIAGITHRAIARAADVSLASTTYHFTGKFDILAAVSQAMLDEDRLLLPRPDLVNPEWQSEEFHPRSQVLQFLLEATGALRVRCTCWTEIMLDAPRHAESLGLAHRWFAAAAEIWREWSLTVGGSDGALAARSYGDVTAGLLLFVLVLRPSEDDLRAVFNAGEDPLDRWRRHEETPAAKPARLSGKSAVTREAILAATMDELVSKGQTAIGLKAMASKAGLSPSGAFYHFPTTASLIAAAQHRLFENAKNRYRTVAPLDRGHESLEELIDRTTVIFFREATEYARESLAIYRVWLEASRQPSLQSAIWNDIENQHSAWRRLLTPISSSLRPIDPLLSQALFTGKLIRLVATGSQTEDLANVRREFAHDLTLITSGRFWL